MSEITKKLEEYRQNKLKNSSKIEVKEEFKQLKEKLIEDKDLSVSNSEDTEEEIDVSLNCISLTNLLYYGLCFTLWCILYAIFIKLQFGCIFFLVSCLVGIFVNTRTRPRKKGEISAYSVFNKDCKSIDGTLKAEQFENEIRYGPVLMN